MSLRCSSFRTTNLISMVRGVYTLCFSSLSFVLSSVVPLEVDADERQPTLVLPHSNLTARPGKGRGRSIIILLVSSSLWSPLYSPGAFQLLLMCFIGVADQVADVFTEDPLAMQFQLLWSKLNFHDLPLRFSAVIANMY